MDKIEQLRRESAEKEAELVQLRAQLVDAEKLSAENENDKDGGEGEWKWPLAESDYERYSRQMIVPNFGLQGIYSITRSR
jgi:adenylyltransferase/sulfurtransferase